MVHGVFELEAESAWSLQHPRMFFEGLSSLAVSIVNRLLVFKLVVQAQCICPHCPPHPASFKDGRTDGHHMDTFPGVRGCIRVDLLDIGGDRLPDLTALVLWWSALTACAVRPAVGRSVAILGSRIRSSTRLIHPPLCGCVGDGVGGAPWGEAGQSLPGAALGRGMAVQDTCVGSQPNLAVASRRPVSYPSLPSPPRTPPIHSAGYYNYYFFLHIPFLKCFYLRRALPRVVSLCLCCSPFLTPSLRLSPSVFWQGSISSLAVLLGGGRRGSQGTSEYINSHQKANRAEWRLGALSCEWHWAAV